jgi:predicted nucleotidyltransferase
MGYQGLIGDRHLPFEEAGMNREAILALLNAEVRESCRNYGVRSLSLFGSIARRDDREALDLDILVTLKGIGYISMFHGYENRS